MNKKELENEIMKTQEQLDKLQTALKEAEELEKDVPDELAFVYGSEYCYMDSQGTVCETIFAYTGCDLNRKSTRRAFKNQKYAEAFAKKTQFIADMLHFKYLYDRDYEPDWDLDYELKFFVYYNNKTKKFDFSYRTAYSCIESVYFSSMQLAERCVDWLNKKYKSSNSKESLK